MVLRHLLLLRRKVLTLPLLRNSISISIPSPTPLLQTRANSNTLFNTHIRSLSSPSPFEAHLLRLLQSEINYELQTNPPTKVHRDDIPFNLEDKPREQWVSLHRKYGKENIKVEALMIDVSPSQEYQQVGDDQVACSISLCITINKGEGQGKPPMSMVIECSAHPDMIIIGKVAIMEEGLHYQRPYFKELSEDVRKLIMEFLEERGINNDLSAFLFEYMLNKSKEEYIAWLHTVKSFVERN